MKPIITQQARNALPAGPFLGRLWLAVLVAAGFGLASSLQAQLVYQESFRFEAAPGWEFSQGNSTPGPRLTASAVPVAADPEFGAPAIDNNGNGWLRLATTTQNQSNAVALDSGFAAQGSTITVAFDFAFWKPGGDPADGITAFFWDAAQPFNPGAFGGSLGYANRTGIDGLAGGYVGVGLDVFGNYSNPTEGRNGGTSFKPGEVAVRGQGSGQTGYEFLAGTDSNGLDSLTDIFGPGFRMDFPNSPRRPDQDAADFRRFEMTLSGDNFLTVSMQNGFSGVMTELFTIEVPGIRPDQLRFGFAGSTGGSIEVYEIRNFELLVVGGTNAFYWDNEANNTFWNTALNWDKDAVPVDHSHVYFTDRFAGTQTPQTVNANISPILNSATFSGATPYTLTGNTLTFDTDGNGSSYLNVLNSPFGNASHSIANNISLVNELNVQNLVNQTLTLTGNVATNGQALNFVTGLAGETRAEGVISGSGNIGVSGEGTTVFNGNNTYTGTTTVLNTGTLRVESANALGSTGTGTTVQSGGTLALAGNTTFAAENVSIAGTGSKNQGALHNAAGTNTWTGQVNLTNNATIGVAAGTQMNINGVIDTGTANHNLTLNVGSGGLLNINNNIIDPWSAGSQLIKNGTGTAIINANTNYTGATTINAGTLQANTNSALGVDSAPVTVNSGGTLALGGSSFSYNSKSLTLNGAGAAGKAALWNQENNHTWQGAITLGSATTIGSNSGNLTLGQGIANGNGQHLTINGNGTVALTNAGNIQSVGLLDIQSGTFRTGNNVQIGANATNAARVNVAQGATLNLTAMSGTEFLASLSGGGNVQMSSNINSSVTLGGNNQNTTFSGTISGGSALIKAGTGTTIFSGSNTFNNRLQINSGTIALGANNVFANTMELRLSGGTFATNGYSDTMGTLNRTNAGGILDFSATPGSILNFSSITGSGLLTINNWIGSLTGGGDSQLISANNTNANLNSINFTGWGEGATLVGNEVVPTLSGFFIWDNTGASNTWRNNNNNPWIGNAPPNTTAGTRVYFGNDASNQSQTVVLDTITTGPPGNRPGDRTVGIMIIDATGNRSYEYNSSGGNADLIFNNSGNGAYLTVAGNQSHTIGAVNANNQRVNVLLQDNLLISNNSSASVGLTFGTSGGNHVFNTNGNTATFTGSGTTLINSQITGTGSVNLNSTGNLRLVNNSNSYSGGTILNAGTLQIGADDALGSGRLTINGGTLEPFGDNRTISNAYTVNNGFAVVGGNDRRLNFNGTGTLSAGQHAINVAPSTYVNVFGVLEGSGGIVKEGEGGYYLYNRNNSFTGPLTVNGGQFYAIADTGSAANFTFGSTAAEQNFLGQGTQFTVNGGEGGAVLRQGGNMTFTSNAVLTSNGGETYFINYHPTNPGVTQHDFQFNGTANVNDGTFFLDSSRDMTVGASGNINASGGETFLRYARDFTTSGTSANPASINVTNDGLVTVLNDNATNATFTQGQHDVFNVTGPNANLVINNAGSGNNTATFNGTVNLSQGGTLSAINTDVSLSSTALLNGGSTLNKGTLYIQDGNLTVNNATIIANAPNVTMDVSTGNTQVINGATAETSIENLGILTITGEGTVEIGNNVNNIQAQKIRIEGGTLLSSDNDLIENFTPMELAGGTWNTGGYSEVLGTLTLSANSTLDLANGASIINFADSSGKTWDSNETLFITNWSGSATGGGTDQVYFGNTADGLTGGQLGRIIFVDPYGDGKNYAARILDTGEIVPIPEPGAIAAGIGLFGLIAWRERKRIKAWLDARKG